MLAGDAIVADWARKEGKGVGKRFGYVFLAMRGVMGICWEVEGGL